MRLRLSQITVEIWKYFSQFTHHFQKILSSQQLITRVGHELLLQQIQLLQFINTLLLGDEL